MALVICPECGHLISEHAEKCPNCAFPMGCHKKSTQSVNESKNSIVHTCWFCDSRIATTTYHHKFSEVQQYNTTMMRKQRTLSKEVDIPCCSECKKALDSKDKYSFIGVIIGILCLIPLDVWLYKMDVSYLIMALIFEFLFVGILVALLFGYIGTLLWKLTHRQMNALLKHDLDEHLAKKELERYASTHPLGKPTFSEFLGINQSKV